VLITQTPLRMSFAGGGTDLKDFYGSEPGMVLSTTIDKYVYVLLKERYDERIVLSWTHKEIVNSVDEIRHELIREGMRLTGLGQGVEVITTADIPSEGSGLGSSSAVMVGLLNAFYAHRGEAVSAERLAQEACRIEVEVLQKPIGKQDQYIAAYGNFRQFTFHPDGSVTNERVVISKEMRRLLQSSCLLFYTNRTRSASLVLQEQKQNTLERRAILRAMKQQVVALRDCLEKGDLQAVGGLLHEGWCLKRQMASQISDTELDAMYTTARKAGALGGKLLGAGGGGFMLLLCPLERQEPVRQALKGYREMPFRFESDGSKVIFNIKRDTWKL